MYKPQIYDLPKMSADECKRAIEREHVSLSEEIYALRNQVSALMEQIDAAKICYKKTALVLNERITMCKATEAKKEDAL